MANSAQRRADEANELLHRAQMFEETGDRRAAIVTIEEFCRCCPTNADGWTYLSYLWLMDGGYRRALDAATGALRYDPDGFAALVNAGISAFKLGDLRTAQAHLERAIRVDPFHANAQLRLGQVLAALKETARAIEAFVRAIGESRRVPRSTQWIIEQAAAGLAAIEPTPPLNGLLGALHDGVRWLVAGKLARAYQCLERAREGPCGLGMPAIREAAKTLLDEVWRRHARMTQTPDDAERPCTPLLQLRP